MSSHLWFAYACLSALFWGLCYALSGRVLQAGVPTALLLALDAALAVPLLVAVAHFTGVLRPGASFLFSDYKLCGLVALVALLTVAGNLFILFSIEQKNATLSSLIEISYPLFTFAFSWLLFRDMQLTWAASARFLSCAASPSSA